MTTKTAEHQTLSLTDEPTKYRLLSCTNSLILKQDGNIQVKGTLLELTFDEEFCGYTDGFYAPPTCRDVSAGLKSIISSEDAYDEVNELYLNPCVKKINTFPFYAQKKLTTLYSSKIKYIFTKFSNVLTH